MLPSRDPLCQANPLCGPPCVQAKPLRNAARLNRDHSGFPLACTHPTPTSWKEGLPLLCSKELLQK